MATEYPPLGKSYVSGYANNERDYPIVSIRKDPRVDNYKIPNDLSPHPDASRWPNHVFTGAQPTRSDERVEWVYEILPGPWVPFTRYDENLGPIQGRRRSVANTGQTASLATTQKRTYEGREGSAIVSIEIEENWSNGSGSENNPSFPINTSDVYDERLGPVEIQRQLVVATGDEFGSITQDGNTVTEVEYEPYNEFLLVRTVKRYSLPSVDLTGQATGQWGVESTSRRSVNNGTSADSGFGIKNSAVQPQGDGSSIKQTESYPPDSDNDGIIYTLYGQEEDETTKAVVSVYKSLVEAGTVESGRVSNYISGLRADDYTVEVQPVDKWHSITIASKITSPPQNETWTETGNISLPNRLLSVGVIWDKNIDSSEGTAGVDDISGVISNDVSWNVKAEAVITGSFSGRPFTRVESGYNGPAEVTVQRTFTFGEPTGAISVRNFKPVFGYITIYGITQQKNGVSYVAGQGDTRAASGGYTRFSGDSDMVVHDFGPVEHNNPTLQALGDGSGALSGSASASGGSVPGGGFYPAIFVSLNLQARANLELPSSSTPLNSGEEFIKQVVTRPWRLGWWVREVYTARVP
jgi:hypothetical protein